MNSVKIRLRGWIQQQVKIYDSLQNYVIELDIAQRTACILFLKHLISLKANICTMTIDKELKLLILNETESANQEWKLTLNYPSILKTNRT